jgi:hypothetical protein
LEDAKIIGHHFATGENDQLAAAGFLIASVGALAVVPDIKQTL